MQRGVRCPCAVTSGIGADPLAVESRAASIGSMAPIFVYQFGREITYHCTALQIGDFRTDKRSRAWVEGIRGTKNRAVGVD